MLTTVLDVVGLTCLVATFAVLFGLAGLLGAAGVAALVLSWRIEAAAQSARAARRAEVNV